MDLIAKEGQFFIKSIVPNPKAVKSHREANKRFGYLDFSKGKMKVRLKIKPK